MRLLTVFLCLCLSSITYAADFTLTSTAFKNNGDIPELYTCKGKDISPQLSWSGAPANTKSFALILSDPDAPNGVWYHWLVSNIPGNEKELTENINKFANGMVEGTNSFNRIDYNGPCPPPGNAHHYVFTLYALDTKLNLPEGMDVVSLQKALEGHVLQSVTLTGLYTRP